MARELATSRRVRKGPLPSIATPGDARLPASDRPAAEPPAVGPLSPQIRERVVADVRHEIGNFFHKLYYWADFLSDSRSGRSGDVTATQILEETIHGLEDLLRVALEYVRPIAATPIRMDAREVVDGVVKHLTTGLEGRRVTLAPDAAVAASGASVLVDPGRLSQALGFLVRRLAATAGPGATVSVVAEIHRSARGDTLALHIRLPSPDASAASRTTVAEVEWATAENIIRALGGELTARDDGGGETAIGLVLPLDA